MAFVLLSIEIATLATIAFDAFCLIEKLTRYL